MDQADRYMDEPTQRREYLRHALMERGVELKQASLAIGRSESYIQQYLGTPKKAPKPRYLSEQDRKALVRAYPFLNEERLKPPEKIIKPKSLTRVGLPEVDPKDVSDFMNAPENQTFLRLWVGFNDDTKLITLDILEAIGRIAAAARKAS